MSPDNLVELEHVSFAYERARPVLSGVTLRIPRGKVVAIMGGSGSGKTTILRLIGGALRATGGEVRVFGSSMKRIGAAELYRLRRRMGMLFQFGALFTDLSVFENVAFPMRERTGLPDELIRPLVLMKLQAVGLRGAAALMPQQLSGGMARRVALARAVVMDPELLIYDEPFVGLDPISMGVIVRLIRQMNRVLGITSIVVSHDVRELATIADDSYLLSQGRCVASGSPEELHRSESEVVRQFLDGVADGPVPFHYPAPDYRDELLGVGRHARGRKAA